MNVTESLRAAVADPPPTSIDVDRLVANEFARARRIRMVAGAGSLVAVLTLAVAVPIALHSGDPLWTPGTPTATTGLRHPAAPVPTEPADKALPRLYAALMPALQSVMPANITWPQAEFGMYAAGDYRVETSLTGGDDPATLTVRVWSAPPPPPRVCPKEWCGPNAYPDGSVGYTGVLPECRPGGGTCMQAELYRPDGTAVMVSLFADPKPDRAVVLALPLSMEQLVTLSRVPGLTLFP